jgi:structural maintenance of chromosome 2
MFWRRLIGIPTGIGFILRVEKKQTELLHKLSTVKQDKKKIEKTIVELDEYKKEALMKTWKKVNGYHFLLL